ncbi:von Willebrand factor A domain-containing protein 7-like [Haliotis rufescens]|uniref:von Willebrand factor A domain-containing protein 7-like n=1 Tax=Haliotis rufescens TaxID=6454 RepID=UPI00201E7D89|nr:von Willebrand factor A domain-containing protein 7-like [Haliotis rufescens]
MSTISSSSTMRLVACLWVMLHVLPQGVITFFPSRLSGVDIGDGTLTHADITEVGILKAVASNFEANPRPNSTLAAGDLTQMKNITTRKLFQAYYGEGVSETRFQDTITSIINANNQVNLNLFNVSAWHCNGETIREANQKMMNLREQAIAVLSQSNTNFDQARNLIGQFLHILQMFYSNTNWIEFSGAVPYYSLGIRNKPLLGQAPPVMDACVSCGGELDKMCEDNIIVDGKILTSGYRSGQDAVKPHKHHSISNTGKCSHGGPLDDTSSSVAALGGINKDSTLGSLSPHSHLHQAAAQAAIEHTTYFFDDEEYGIRGIIGIKKFNELFQLKPEASVVFVIDYSGSMKEDIAAVSSVIRATLEKPVNYILSLFSDPLSKSRVYLTDDGNDALRYLDEISISGGEDCPEYAMDGLMNALTVCNYNIDVFVFTDASAKDAPLHVAVLSLAALKNVHLQFILTGDCGFWNKPTGEDLYRTLATATGGSVYFTNKDGIATVVDIIKESLTPSVTIAKSSISASDVNVTFPVDQTILQATIKIVTLDRNTPVYILGELDKMCEDNMIVDGKILTSGYRSGQDAVKPHKHHSISNTGKCSHGGPLDDTSSSVAALGGINKDSTLGSLSPHSHLHQAAAQAAIEHTTYFFDDEEYGIRGIIGIKKFNELFQLKPEASVVFVIDYSGSMKEDIAAVSSVIRATLEKPVNYILSLFSDPLSKSRVYLTDDGNDALRYLDEISISGGEDCPEYAMDGLMNGEEHHCVMLIT